MLCARALERAGPHSQGAFVRAHHGEGNHGEDVKESYAYLDAVPSYAFAQALYRYPQAAYPYARLVEENRRRGRSESEFELADTGVLDGGRYWDVTVEYAKASPDDTLIRIVAANRGPEAAELHLLPTLWFRNTWIWGCRHEGCTMKPLIRGTAPGTVLTSHESLEPFAFHAAPGPDAAPPELLFTGNETNSLRLYGEPTWTPYVKDAFHERIVGGRFDAVDPGGKGTKVAAWYPPCRACRWRLRRSLCGSGPSGKTVARLPLAPRSRRASRIDGRRPTRSTRSA